ncbi:MAG: aminotransferase class IV [Haliea sp.]|uniref:aminotransferase class IV n=1 Tax=Haliea sp. TaxID=1932666 RepID=UPI0032EB36A7
MSIVYLNGDYLPMSEARISPMDRGFLFGDGIYEVVPSYAGKLVGFGPHMQRMQQGLDAIEIKLKVDETQWRGIANELIARNGRGNLGIYFHISRGADSRRNHAYPENVAPTLYAFAFEIPPAPVADKTTATCYRVSTAEDLRWRRCNIKSTALLGNVMHYQHGYSRGHGETILYNEAGELTEAAACNVFVVKDGAVATPELDHQKLPGITRLMLLDILRKHSEIPIAERVVTMAEVHAADEVWLTSSSKEVAPVIEIDGKPVGQGGIGDVWLAAASLFTRHRYDY